MDQPPPLVIGIGMPKTGLHSLKTALERVGYTALQDVKRTWPAVRAAEKAHRPLLSSLADRWDAFLDGPMCSRWWLLAEQYPEAGLILTTRDPEQRARSWQLHNQRAGRARGDMEGHMIAHRKHDKAVQQRLAGKGRLLVLPVETASYAALCGFLGVPSVREPWPRRNRKRPPSGVETLPPYRL